MKFDRSSVYTITILMVIILLVAIAVWWSLERKAASDLRSSSAGVALASQSAASFTDLSGNELTLDGFVGQVLIVHSWASWCPQCAADLLVLEQVAGEFAAEELAVLAINRAEPASTAERYLRRTIGTDTAVQLVLDPDDSFYDSMDGYAMPETVIFNPTGTEVARYRTELSAEELSNVVRSAMK